MTQPTTDFEPTTLATPDARSAADADATIGAQILPQFVPPADPSQSVGHATAGPTKAPRFTRRKRAVTLPPLEAKTLAAIVLVGFLGNLALRTGITSLASFVAVAALSLVLIQQNVVQSRWGRVLLLGAILSAVWLPLRSSPWLAPFNFLTVVGLIAAAVTVGQMDLWQFHPRHLGSLLRRFAKMARGPQLVVHSGSTLIRSGAAAKGGGANGPGKAIARGVLLALVPLVPIVALLASADVVFASFLRTPGDAGSLMTHVVLTLVATTLAAGLFAVALSPEPTGPVSYRRPLGSTEATVVLLGLVLVFSAFALTQMLTALGGAAHVLETANLTRADYAREGFFQLLAVSVITLAVLFGTRIFVQTGSRAANFRLTVLAAVASLLTIVIVAVSLLRLSLYVDAFGLTMLRLYSMVFGAFLGAVFLLYIGHLLAPAARLWFVPTVGLVAWLFLMVLNAVNPEAAVINWNTSHQATTYEFDVRHATRLSSDSIPALVDQLDELPTDVAAQVVDRLCRGFDDDAPAFGMFDWNGSQAQAKRSIASLDCASR